MNEENCFLCSDILGDDAACMKLTPKGIAGIIHASTQREDEIHKLLNPLPTDAVIVHSECRRVYVNPLKIKSDSKKRTLQEPIPSTSSRLLRGHVESFSFKDNCLFCGCLITDSEIRKKSAVIPVRTFQFRETIVQVCNTRSDLWAANVHSRLLSVIDLPAAEARYHQICSITFRKGDSIPVRYRHEEYEEVSTSMGRPNDTVKQEAFVRLCEWLEENSEDSTSVQELVKKMQVFLPEGTEPYSPRHLQKKLIGWFGNDITISCKEGKPNIVTFGKTAADIILDYHKQTRIEDPNQEKFRIIESAAKLIKSEINLLCDNMDFYPSASDIASLEENKNILPPVLQTFMDTLITKTGCDLKKAAIGQSIIQACRPRSFICPIPLGIGVQVHRDFGSRLLIDELYRLGFSVSYDEVQRFLQSSVMEERNVDAIPAGSFSQWVADNVDHNIVTIDGHNTFHGMGIIMCTSGEFGNASFLLTEKIKRLKNRLPANEISRKAKIPLHFIQSPSATTMNKIKFERLTDEPIQTNMLDVLWSCSRLFGQPHPGWLGFMQTVVVGENPGKTVTSFLPMIDLNPTSHSCVYTTLKFVCEEARRLNVATPIITFDQCLWIKAMEVICSNNEGEFDNIVVRLGGFHTLMSFLGTIGDLMGGSGIEEVLQTVYAENTVPHMLTGKAYSRALRGHFLISSALTAVIIADLLKSSTQTEDNANSNANKCTLRSNTCEPMEVQTDVDLHLNYLRELHEKLLRGQIELEEVTSSTVLLKLSSLIEERTNLLKSQSRTSKLWILYLNMVEIAKTFIWAERTGNFEMHLQAVSHMLPFFASLGHNNYAKCARIYLQQMRKLKETNPKVYKILNDGYFTVRKHERKWTGVWTDMCIEQTLMRCTKSRSGITHGGGMTESQRATWIMSHSRCSEIAYAMSLLTGITRISSEQHSEISDARMGRDFQDMKAIMDFFNSHNPFDTCASGLWNIFSGIADSENKVTAEKADIIGKNIQDKLTGKLFKNVTMLKSDQAVTMKVLKKGIIIADETHHIDTHLLTQRMLVCVSLDNTSKDAREYFRYELSTIPPSLFDPRTQLMRKTDKSSLGRSLDSMTVHRTECSQAHAHTHFVLDGGALLHKLAWTKNGTFIDVLRQYESYVDRQYGKATIVFDGYLVPSTKDMEHKSRLKQSSVAVLFDEHSPMIIKKETFLSNNENKQRFINMLGQFFQDLGHNVLYAVADADTLIVKTALSIAEERHTTVVADDTDILVLLLYHSCKNISMQSATHSDHVRDIQAMQESIGEEGCKVLLFAHALTGCDTTSALFGKSKTSAFQHICKSETLRNWGSVFGCQEIMSTDEIIDIGCKVLVSLYGGNINSSSLNMLRYDNYIQKIASSKKEFDISRLPPTENAAKYHLLRVHLQCIVWKILDTTAADPTLWGWQKANEEFQPIMTDISPAPDSLLNMIHCACKITVDEPCYNMRCTCRRYGLPCTSLCKRCCGIDCRNSQRKDDESEWNEGDIE